MNLRCNRTCLTALTHSAVMGPFFVPSFSPAKEEDTMTRREHVEMLAAELGALIHFESDPLRVRASSHLLTNTPQLFLDDYGTYTGYATALHELGHVALGHVFSVVYFLSDDERLAEERNAWVWAEENSLEPLPQELIEFAIKSHETTVVPTADDLRAMIFELTDRINAADGQSHQYVT